MENMALLLGNSVVSLKIKKKIHKNYNLSTADDIHSIVEVDLY